MIEKLLLKLRARDEVSKEEEQALRSAVSEVREEAPDKTLIEADVDLTTSTLLLDGLLCRYKDLGNGKRQITQFHLPGDFVDLHSFTLKRLDHNVMTLTAARVAVFPHDRLEEITTRHPHLTRLLWFTTNVDAACHREWELSLGRRTAVQKVAHLFCELYFRLRLVGLTDGFTFDFPLTQMDVSEAKGLTGVHVNRTLRELREQGLLTFHRGKVTIQDLDGLMALTDFSPNYLYLDRRAV